MKTINKILLTAPFLATFSFATYANDYKTTVEYRHEYKDGSKKFSDRFKVFLDTGNNIGFELDARYNNEEENKQYDSMSMNGSEFSAFYYKSLTENLVGVAGTSLDFNPDGLVYVPYVRLNYKFDNGIRTQVRYKWKLWDYGMVGQNGQSYHSKIQELDTWLGYSTGNWDFQSEFQYWKEMEANGLALYDNKDTNYLYNFRIMYSIFTESGTKWRPFVEVGNVSQSRYTDDRQTRYRVGVKYTW